MAREVKQCKVTREPVTVAIKKDLGEWLVENAPETAVTLLAFDLDGLIWGKIKSNSLITAPNSVPLNAVTLQEARLFGETAELHLWRVDNELKAQIVTDDLQCGGNEYMDETQILWGDQAEPIGESSFTLMSDGVQGLHHAIPAHVPKPTKEQASKTNSEQYKERPLHLVVRHYLAQESFARIEFSRLVALCIDGKDCSEKKELQS